MDGKHIQFGNEGEELVPGKTENLSSTLHQEGDAAEPDAFIGKDDESQRGERPQFDRRSDEVSGSGSNAGGSTNPDPQVPR